MIDANSVTFEQAARLEHLGGLIWLDSSESGVGALSILAAAPTEILTGNLSEAAERIRSCLAEHAKPHSDWGPIPDGGLFGWIGFDGAFSLGLYPACAVYEHDSGTWHDPSGLRARGVKNTPPARFSPALDFQSMLSRQDFLVAVDRARDYIAAGDIYQVNLSYPWSADWPAAGDSLGFYQRLRAVSPAPFSAYLDLDGVTLFSASPECFLKMNGREILTRPIKGTRPRFPADSDQDAQSAVELLGSEKERAELLMITDLERNDLGQVCDFGSVFVPELWAVESFAQVHHLVSTVKGTLKPGIDHVSALAACFPGGSISGAPKKRALDIIQELEKTPRGIYTGAIGYFGFNGQSQFSIAIRTAVKKGGEISFQVGSGIVADSVPEREYEETLHKAAGILRAARP